MTQSGMGAWRRTAKFYVDNGGALLPVLPLCFIPVYGDALLSVLIRQKVGSGEMSRLDAMSEAARMLPRLAAMKMYFWGVAFLWEFVPIYGLLRAVGERLHWAMTSSVLAFEGLSGAEGRARCRQLVASARSGLLARTLVTLPCLAFAVAALIWIIAASANENLFGPGLVLLLVAGVIICLPVSGTVNTFLYLQMLEPAAPEAFDARVRAKLPDPIG